jgi:hypothetical protein
LRKGIDQYLEALTQRNPKQLVLAPQVKFTENGSVQKIGEGLWAKATGLGTYQHVFTDTTTQQAMFIGIVNEGNDGSEPAIASIRLGFVHGKVTEIEHVVARKGSHPLFAPEGADDGCQRIENGKPTTGTPDNPHYNCARSADLLLYIKAVKNRRYPIVDVEHGVVVATILFDIPPGEDTTGPKPKTSPRTLLLTEWFKIDDGKIQHIEAIMHNLPYGSKSGWED